MPNEILPETSQSTNNNQDTMNNKISNIELQQNITQTTPSIKDEFKNNFTPYVETPSPNQQLQQTPSLNKEFQQTPSLNQPLQQTPSPNSLQQTSLENNQFKIPINNEKNKILNNNSKINSEEAKEDTISGGSTITSSLTSRIQSELKKLFNYS